MPGHNKNEPTTVAARLAAWLIARCYPEDFRRAHGRELRDASAWTLASSPRNPLTAARLLADLALGAIRQHASEFARDVRYAARTLSRAKWFTACAIFSLAMAAGTVLPIYLTFANTIFRNVDAIASPESLTAARQPVSYPHYLEIRNSPTSPFAELTAFQPRVPMVMRSGQGATSERLWGQLIAPDYFDVLGVPLHRGRFTKADRTAVISHHLWQTRFGEQPGAIGRTIRLNGQLIEIVAIAPPGFNGTSPILAAADLWLTAETPGFTQTPAHESRIASFQIAGRLRPGLNHARAEAALDSQMRHLEPGLKRDDKSMRLQLMPGARVLSVPSAAIPVFVGFPAAIALLTLWIACSNVGALMLARAASRRREVAVRAALGAGRGRIVRQLLTESLLLSLAGAAVGLAVTIGSLRYSDTLNSLLPGFSRLDLSGGTGGQLNSAIFALATALVSTLLCGLAPAWQVSRIGVSAALKDAAGDLAFPRFRWFGTRNQLILQQVAASLCLLLLCGYITLAISRGPQLDLGFNTARLGTVSVDPLRDGIPAATASTLLATLPEELRAHPGIESAALAQQSPAVIGMPETASASLPSNIERRERTDVLRIGEGYLETLGVPVLRGRNPGQAEHRGGNRVPSVVINEALARALWPEATDPVGETLDLRFGGRLEPHLVAGIVRNIRNRTFQPAVQPAVYLPVRPERLATLLDSGWTLVVRARPGASPLDAARAAIAARHPDLTVYDAISVDEASARMMALMRMTLATYGTLGAFGLLLSAVGLAGVTAYAVALRTREIGIRVALGATGAQVTRLVLRESVGLLVAGGAAGLALTMFAARLFAGYFKAFALMSKLEFGDPALIASACALLAFLSLAACYIPARRATRVDPVIALRE